MAIEPSPTADATRFTEPCRTSPAASTPGTLVSRGIGVRPSAGSAPALSSDPVTTKPEPSRSIAGGSHSVCGWAPIMRKSA